ncbi:MAG TPA: PRC-barrel domain-containing protein [Stellaceae bacterium]|nr:PRC-barrel domain-containing protein [Stellaceae bacterium]
MLTGLAMFAAPGYAATSALAQNQPAAEGGPASTATPKKTEPENSSKPPENVEPLTSREAAPVLGQKVVGPNGENLGLIVDVLVDPDGRPRAAVIDFGGFLGVGSRKIAIDWKALDFAALGRGGTVQLGLDRAQIARAPEYRPGPPGAKAVTAPPAPAPPVDTHK